MYDHCGSLKASNTRNPEGCRMRVQFFTKPSPAHVRPIAKMVNAQNICYGDNFPANNRRVKRKIFSTLATFHRYSNFTVILPMNYYTAVKSICDL